ncbi:uncharacterized protein TNCV_1587131 [Trichonephila clavipes]|nr:uncharacterized protein TNCV_1587131 [Trichonephila clavipes]
MAPHTITPAVGAACHCKAKAFTTGSLHTNTIAITTEIESGFVAEDDLVPFCCSPVSSCVAPLQTDASMGGRQGQKTDEAHFWLNGYVNKQNCRIWSEANPQVYVETPLHPEKLTVWCALWAGGILLQKR